MYLKDIRIEEFDYNLPEEKIALMPKDKRDESKLLHYNNNKISDFSFHSLPNILEKGDHLILNNTRVIPARLFFRKPTGGLIEIFCLEPLSSGGDFLKALQSKGSIEYECLVGGAAKWKSGNIALKANELELEAEITGRRGEYFHVRFTWNPSELSFSEVLNRCGELPLPPYFNRKADASDLLRYQTVYGSNEGSVAAPTAGLHFTPEIFDTLLQKGISVSYITLHVGAGTFKPVSAANISDHEMHGEYYSIDHSILSRLSQMAPGRIVAVGTTSLRAIESAYWMGCKLSKGIRANNLEQWEAYEMQSELSSSDAFRYILEEIERTGEDKMMASTSIMIGPGYKPRVAKGLVTNFHLPKSSLLVLIAALVGNSWKEIYDHALKNDYRFLSYGDSSLLWIDA